MKFDIKEFILSLHSDFSNEFSKKEIEEILNLSNVYDKDTPISTGKRFLLKRIIFSGVKKTGEDEENPENSFIFNQKIETGINIWIADNLKGKSSIFKVVKFALTGKNSLKPNIKKWINEILITFIIGEKKFSIYLNVRNRILKAFLFNGLLEDFPLIDEDKLPENLIFEAKGNDEFQRELQRFFFNQFEYYSLKWTQKSSQKTSTELQEVGTSWKTYFKSIFLESKDSNSLIYGDQGKKVFEMLLGLELTYSINQLKIKKDKLQYKNAINISTKIENNLEKTNETNNLTTKLDEVTDKLEKLQAESTDLLKLDRLYEELGELSQKLEKEYSEITKNDISLKQLYDEKAKHNNNITSYKNTQKEFEKEIFRKTKNIQEIKEYLEIGSFFSGLEIKICPNCDHTVTHSKKMRQVELKKCSLCNEDIDLSRDTGIDKSKFKDKITHIENLKRKLENEIILYDQKILFSQDSLEEISREILLKEAANEKLKVSPNIDLIKKLKAEIEQINKLTKPKSQLKEKLLSEKAVIEFRITSLSKINSISHTNVSNKIELLSVAINRLNEFRFKLGQKVLKQLSELMLYEIQELGLQSITEIVIDEKLSITYNQDGDFITFDQIAEGEQLRAKMAFYLSLIQLDIEHNYGRHTRFLIIDSPGKEEADENYLHGLSNVLSSIENRFGNNLQILIGTAERGLCNIVKNETVIPKNEFLF